MSLWKRISSYFVTQRFTAVGYVGEPGTVEHCTFENLSRDERTELERLWQYVEAGRQTELSHAQMERLRDLLSKGILTPTDTSAEPPPPRSR